MTVYHAGTDPDLLTRLKQMLGSSARADIAVGYFFMSGFAGVVDDLARLRKTRILVGRADRPTLEAVAAGLRQADALRAQLDADQTVSRRQRQEVTAGTVSEIAQSVAALPQTDANQEAVARLRQLVAAGLLEMRAYPRGFLHAKAYLCWYDDHAEPGAAMVGSSNLSLAGFTGNTELNVRVTGDTEMATLKEWFENLWADAVDLSASVEQSLAVSWAVKEYSPYAIYLKALYELYGQDLGSDAPLPLEPARQVDLANFQLDAVRRGLDMIRNYGGCYIADVVGLGKTHIGAELLRQLRQSYPHDGPPLIICPAGMTDTWEQFNELYGLGAAVLSQDRIAAPPGLTFDPETEEYGEVPAGVRGVSLPATYPRRGPVLVDEAHNFRNDVNRSRGLRDYLEQGEHRVILLSATPQNLGPRDIYRQVRLFLDETEHGLPLEPPGLEDYFASVVRWQQYRREVDAYSALLAEHLKRGGAGPAPRPPERPGTPPADLAEVLTPVFIRRRRKDIKELYGDTATISGQPVEFPEPKLSNLEYRLDRVYARAGNFTDLLATLGRHRAARYNPTEYLKPARRREPRYAGLFRARGRIAGMIQHLLMKRLESSIEAFRATLQSISNSNRNFHAALQAGYVPVGSVATGLLAGQHYDPQEALNVLQREEAAPAGKTHFPAADFDLARWNAALDADYAVLTELLARIADIGPADDDKLATLQAFLKRPEVSGEKTLVFSEAETTVDYLYRQLNPGGADPTIARLSGSNRNQRAGIVRRFAPQANPTAGGLPAGPQAAPQSKPQAGLPAEPKAGSRAGSRAEPGIRVLITTDVLSEGQNLQDCARVLNYDLHWNPVRLIQRFGRVDRIGSPHDVIYLHNMMPDAELDEELGLTATLGDRLQAFHDLIGLDNKVLSEAEQLNAKGIGVIYDEQRLPEMDDALDEVSANQRAIALLENIRGNDPALWQQIQTLPDGIRSALAVRHRASGEGSDAPQVGETVVLLAAATAVRCYAVADSLAPRPIRPAQFVAAVECEPDAPARPLPENTNARVDACAGVFATDLTRLLGSGRRRGAGNTRNRQFIQRQLNGIDLGIVAPQRIAALRQAFAADLPGVVEQELSELRRLNLGGRELVRRLELLRERYRLNPAAEREATPAPHVWRIICSEGLQQGSNSNLG